MRRRQIGVGASHMSLPQLVPEGAARGLLQDMMSANLRFLDTADSYGWHLTDANRGEALLAVLVSEIDPCRESITVATKGGFVHDQGHWTLNGDPVALSRAIENSFQAMGGSRPIGLWQLHSPDPEVPIGRSLEAAAIAQKKGLVQEIGVCNVSAEQLREALDTVPLFSVQNQHSPWYRHPDCEEIFSICSDNRLVFFAHTPFGGKNAWQIVNRLGSLKRLAVKYSVPLYSILVAWLLCENPCIIPLIGTTNPAHLRSNQEACQLQLAPEDLQELDVTFRKARAWLAH
jgi:aryl-alcohol dehydrogenase-like predicted oxidoreductase